MIKIYLDDIRIPVGNWIVVHNYIEFVDKIKELGIENIEEVSMDHDLADEHYRPSMYDPDKHYSNYYTDGTFKEKTGFDCAKYLVNLCMDNNISMPQVYVHSSNPVGCENIMSMINQYYKHTGSTMICTKKITDFTTEVWY